MLYQIFITAVNFSRLARFSNECTTIEIVIILQENAWFPLDPEGNSTRLDLRESIELDLHLIWTSDAEMTQIYNIINRGTGLCLFFFFFFPAVKLLMLEFMTEKKTQWRGINWGQLLCRENQEFICLDLPSSHILINIRGVILASVYNDNSFSWLWLIGWGKEINSFILFYSTSSTLCVIFKLLSDWCIHRVLWLMIISAYIIPQELKQICPIMHSSHSIFIMIFFNPCKLCLMYILDYLPAILHISNSTVCCLEVCWGGLSTSHSLKLIW